MFFIIFPESFSLENHLFQFIKNKLIARLREEEREIETKMSLSYLF